MTINHSDLATEAVKAGPAIAVSGLTFMGVALSDWLILLTIVYTLAQLGFLVRDKWWRQRKGKNGRK